jgi:hypothetical protein
MTRNISGPRGLVAVAVLALASRGAAQQAGAASSTSDAFDRACVDLIHGKVPKGGAQAADALRDACATLMKTRAEEKKTQQQKAQQKKQAQAQTGAAGASAQGPSAQVQAGQSSAPAQPGQSAVAAFEQAGGELVTGKPRGSTMGMRRGGEPFVSTLVTNPVGWFTGVGVNADYVRSFQTKFNWTAGAHYSQANASGTSSLYEAGFLGGVDWFIIGKNNEGLRVGPRFDVSFGREADPAGGNSTRARLGITGELGYNFIASNGITGQAAFGLGGRVAGDKNDSLSSSVGGEFGPYGKLGVGYSW